MERPVGPYIPTSAERTYERFTQANGHRLYVAAKLRSAAGLQAI